MANKFTTKVTNEGVTLLQEASQQDKKVEFINAIASSTAYSESQLISETYDDINSRASKNQTGTINNITIDKNITRMELVFDGHDVKSDYTLNSIFLIAKLKDSQDLKLFAVIKANQPQYMNSYDGSGSTNLQINLGIKFSNNDRVTLQVDTAAIATLGDLSNLRNETQTKLDKETSRATEKETSLQKDLEIEKNRASQSEIELQNKIDSEISRAQKTEKDITASLSAEKNRAIQVENDLSGRITTEQNRAMSRENYIDVKIDKEKDRATSKENSLEQLFDTERRRATDAENTLSGRININHNDVVARYNVLNNSIDIEKNRAMTKENSLDKRIDGVQKSVTDEQTRATTKENEIDNNLQSVKNSLDDLQVGGTNLLTGTSNEWKTWTGTGWANQTLDAGPINLDAGTYTFRAEIDNTGNSQKNVKAEIYVESKSKNMYDLASYYHEEIVEANSKGYVKATFTIKTPLERVRIRPHTVVGGVLLTTTTIKWRKEKLEQGTIATDWSPAPEDLATKLQLNQVIDTTNNMQKQITDETSRATKAEKDIKDLANSNKSRLDAKDAHIFIDNKSDDVTNIFDVRDKYNTKNIIQSLVGDEWGSAVGIGNAGLTVIGGGESSSSILHHVKNKTAIDGTVYQPQNEELFLASDSNVKIITNTQDSSNPANYKVTNFDTNGNMKLPGDVYINGGSYSISDMFKFMEAPNLIYNSEFMVDHGVISGWNDFTNINSQKDGYLGSKALYITAPMRANSPTEADTRIFYSKEIKGLGRYPNSRPKIFSLSFKIMPLSYKTFSKDLYIIPYFSFNNGSEISIENSIIKAGSSTQTWYNFEKIFTINDSYDNGFRIKFKIIGISQTNVLLSQPMLSATPIPIPYKPNYGNIADFMVGGGS